MASLATRIKVLTVVASAKDKSGETIEQQLWTPAGKSVIEHSMKLDQLEANAS